MKTLYAHFALACCILAVCSSLTQVVALNDEAPKLESAKLNVSPLIQGVEGNLRIETLVRVNGTC